MSVDLLLKQAPVSQPAELLFGEVDTVGDIDANAAVALPSLTVAALAGRLNEATAAVTLPALQVQALAAPVYLATVVVALPSLTVVAEALFDSATERPMVAQAATPWQDAQARPQGSQERHQRTTPLPASADAPWARAVALPSPVRAAHQTGERSRTGATGRHQDTERLRTGLRATHQDGQRDRRLARGARHQDAERAPAAWPGLYRWQDMLREPRPARVARWQGAAAGASREQHEAWAPARPLLRWRGTRHQDARRPPAGRSTWGTVVPPPAVCYLPDADLVFGGALGDTALVFVCDGWTPAPPATVTVPIRRVYLVINDVQLKRAVDNVPVPATSMSLSIDASSWAWGFNATLPGAALDMVLPDAGAPVELLATVNGASFRVLAETIGRDRTFGKATVKVSGRSRSALLASPYSAPVSRTNSIDRTAQQLTGDVLTLNGVPLDWSVDWGLTDWLVPAGAWQHRGTYMEALLAIVGAAGGYIQPHPTDTQVLALPRYPVAPWDWGTATPDVELPSAIALQEGIAWTEKPAYNRVFVSGANAGGVLCQVTRAGTDGALAAQMVTDPLITHADVGRQRGVAVLADTGRQAQITLRTPVLAEAGVITPGKLVRYTDGGVERMGLVRSTQVDAGFPAVWQTLKLETHV